MRPIPDRCILFSDDDQIMLLNPDSKQLLGLLTPIIPAVPTIRAKDRITKQWPNINSQYEFDLALAAAYVRDANNQQGEYGEARASKSNRFRRYSYFWYNSPYWKFYLYTIYVCHCICTFFEAPNVPLSQIPWCLEMPPKSHLPGIGQKYNSDYQVYLVPGWVLVVNTIAVLSYILDCTLRCIFCDIKNTISWESNIFTLMIFKFNAILFRNSKNHLDEENIKETKKEQKAEEVLSSQLNNSRILLFLHLQLIVTFFLSIDLIILYIQILSFTRLLQPFRCLRMTILACWNKQIGHLFTVLISIMVSLLKVIGAVFAFIIAYAALGMHVFLETYHLVCYNEAGEFYINKDYDVDDLPTECGAGFTESEYSHSFDNIIIATFRMFILLTTENYPDFMMPAYWILSPGAWLYFGIFILIGLFLLQSFILAVIVNIFWTYNKKNLKHDREVSRLALIKAWNLLDTENSGRISIEDKKLDDLVKNLRPELSDDETFREVRIALINSLDYQGDGFIDTYDWNLHGFELLTVEIEENKEGNEENLAGKVINRQGHLYEIFLPYRQMFILTIGICHSILFLIKFPTLVKPADIFLHSFRILFSVLMFSEAMINYFYHTYRAADNKQTAWIMHKHFYSKAPYPTIDIAMMFFTVVSNICWLVLELIVWKDLNTLGHEAIVGVLDSVGGILIFLRILMYWKQSLYGIQILLYTMPVLFSLFITIFIFLYFLAVIGYETFQEIPLNGTVAIDFAGSPQAYGCQFGFINFSCAFLAVFQILTTNNWNDYVNTAILDTNSIFSAIYFIIAFLIFNFFVINILTANVIQAYSQAIPIFSEEERQRQKIKEEYEYEDSLDLDELVSTAGTVIFSDDSEEQRRSIVKKSKQGRITFRRSKRGSKDSNATKIIRTSVSSPLPSKNSSKKISSLKQPLGPGGRRYSVIARDIKRRQSLALGVNKMPRYLINEIKEEKSFRPQRDSEVSVVSQQIDVVTRKFKEHKHATNRTPSPRIQYYLNRNNTNPLGNKIKSTGQDTLTGFGSAKNYKINASPKTLVEVAKVNKPYVSKNIDELDLIPGQDIIVDEKYDDFWWAGHIETHKMSLSDKVPKKFPADNVTSLGFKSSTLTSTLTPKASNFKTVSQVARIHSRHKKSIKTKPRKMSISYVGKGQSYDNTILPFLESPHSTNERILDARLARDQVVEVKKSQASIPNIETLNESSPAPLPEIRLTMVAPRETSNLSKTSLDFEDETSLVVNMRTINKKNKAKLKKSKSFWKRALGSATTITSGLVAEKVEAKEEENKSPLANHSKARNTTSSLQVNGQRRESAFSTRSNKSNISTKYKITKTKTMNLRDLQKMTIMNQEEAKRLSAILRGDAQKHEMAFANRAFQSVSQAHTSGSARKTRTVSSVGETQTHRRTSLDSNLPYKNIRRQSSPNHKEKENDRKLENPKETFQPDWVNKWVKDKNLNLQNTSFNHHLREAIKSKNVDNYQHFYPPPSCTTSFFTY